MALRVVPSEPAAITVLPALAAPGIAEESNHRIANSLQLLAGMVSIEAQRIVDPAARAALHMVMQRVAAIAGVHRQIYRSPGSARIDLGAYLEDLGSDLALSCGDPARGRRVIVEAEAVQVAPEAASYIGVIVSELVANACKYAYSPHQPGDVRVTLRRAMFDGYVLAVSDTGRGFAAGSDAEGSGVGGQLIAIMARSLGAEPIWSDTRPGTRFVLHVPLC